MITLIRLLAYTLVLIIVQTAIAVLLFAISGKAEFPLVIVVFAYLTTILFIQQTGNFVGCANMVEPFLLGVPLGIVTYSLIGSLIITVTRRLRTRG
jgi:hypothetical protein